MSELTLPARFVPDAAAAVRRVANEKARSLFRRSTIQTRLTIAFIALGAMSLFVTLLGVWQLHTMEQHRLRDVRIARLAGELHAVVAVGTAPGAAQGAAERAAPLL